MAHYLSPFVAVLALAIGLVFGLTLLTSWAMREADVAVVDETPAGTPVVVERPMPETNGEAARPQRRVLLVP